MKRILYIVIAGSFLTVNGLTAAEQVDAKTELKTLSAKVQSKMVEGKNSEADFTAELEQFDTLLKKHRGEKTEEVAQIAYFKALVYLQLGQTEKGMALIRSIKKDFPGTRPANEADTTLAQIQKQEDSKKMQESLVEGAQFPGVSAEDINGKPFGLDNYKGKVVLVDFWASWDAASITELPTQVKAYERYHAKGFEILGVNLDQSKEKLTAVTAKEKITWPQYFDGQVWNTKLALKLGVTTLPVNFLVDGEGKIIGRNLRGPDLEAALAKVLK